MYSGRWPKTSDTTLSETETFYGRMALDLLIAIGDAGAEAEIAN